MAKRWIGSISWCRYAYVCAELLSKHANDINNSGIDMLGLFLVSFIFLSYLSFCCAQQLQVGTGIIKYVPQVVLNARRRSTKGWTIWNVILDLTGGVLSVLQARSSVGRVTNRALPSLRSKNRFHSWLLMLFWEYLALACAHIWSSPHAKT